MRVHTFLAVALWSLTSIATEPAKPAAKQTFGLTVQVDPKLVVDVVWSGGEKRCAPPASAPQCSFTIPAGSLVKISAATADGKPFDDTVKPEFDFACAGQGGAPLQRCDLYMYGPRFVMVRNAMAALGKVSAAPSAGGSISSPEMQLWCSAGKTCELTMTVGLAVRFGRVFRISARPDPGYRFVSWGGDCAQQSGDVCVLTFNRERNTTISARFEPSSSAVASTHE